MAFTALIGLSFDQKALEQLPATLQGPVLKAMKEALKGAAAHGANRARQIAKRLYWQHGQTPSSVAANALTFGKREGVENPAIPPQPARGSMSRIAEALEVVRPNSNTWMLQVDPTKTDGRPSKSRPNGTPLGSLAVWLEFPRPWITRLTRRMLAYYKRSMQPGAPGFGSQSPHPPISNAANTTIGYLVVYPRAYPVWRTTFDEVLKEIQADLPNRLKNAVVRVLSKAGWKLT